MDLVNSSSYWFLEGILYLPNTLKVVIIEGIPGKWEEGRKIGPLTIDGPSSRLEFTDESKIVEVVFEGVKTYEVRDEVFEDYDQYKSDKPSRDTLRMFEASEFLSRSGWCAGEKPRHWAILTEWHIINVLSERPPTIRRAADRGAQPPDVARDPTPE